jgi:hypothetical protein
MGQRVELAVNDEQLVTLASRLIQERRQLETLLSAYRRFHEKASCPGGDDCYVCVAEYNAMMSGQVADYGKPLYPQALVEAVWWCDKEQTQANAIFLQDGTKISIRREGGASWMEIGQPRRVVPMGETFECAWCLEAGEGDPARYVHPMNDLAGYTDTAQPICVWCADGAEEGE